MCDALHAKWCPGHVGILVSSTYEPHASGRVHRDVEIETWRLGGPTAAPAAVSTPTATPITAPKALRPYPRPRPRPRPHPRPPAKHDIPGRMPHAHAHAHERNEADFPAMGKSTPQPPIRPVAFFQHIRGTSLTIQAIQQVHNLLFCTDTAPDLDCKAKDGFRAARGDGTQYAASHTQNCNDPHWDRAHNGTSTIVTYMLRPWGITIIAAKCTAEIKSRFGWGGCSYDHYRREMHCRSQVSVWI
jgi:hypothetical protein